MLAIFPALAALVAVYELFADPSAIARHLDQLAFLPGGAIDVAREQLTRVASKGPQTLGLTFLVGLGVSLWSANAAMKSLFDTLNIVYGEEEEKRGFAKLNAISSRSFRREPPRLSRNEKTLPAFPGDGPSLPSCLTVGARR